MNKGQIIVLFHHVFLMLGLFAYGFNIWYALIIFFASMLWAWQVGSNVMHFGFAHKRYKDTLKNKFFALLTLVTGLGSPLSFVASHRQHHKYSDTEKDPHSPDHIGWKRVYFLDWEPQSINPRMLKDWITSKFQKKLHKNFFYYHCLLVIIAFIIDPRLLFFVISPFVIYTFHVGSLQNTLPHMGGVVKNVPIMALIAPWAWRHGDHHSY